VTEVTDLLPRTDGIRLRTDRVRVVIRPSGTEPKLKCYLQVVAPVPDGADLAELRASAAIQMSSLTAEIATAVGLPGS
jgi:phosphomannomutase